MKNQFQNLITRNFLAFAKLGCWSALLSMPFVVMSQTVIFTDTFANGSTTNKTSTPGGTATASSTSYDIASTKTTIPYVAIAANDLTLKLSGGTGSGFWEAQALFTGTPVTLTNVGDYINLTYTFTNTGGTLLGGGSASYILNGLYYSGGSAPVNNGALANAGLNYTALSSYGSGYCAGWQGYVSRISSGAGSQAYTRPAQNTSLGLYSANQDLIGNNFGGGTYTNTPGTIFDATITNTFTLTSGAAYTVSYTIALTAVGTLTVTNSLYSGTGTSGILVFSQTNVCSGVTNITQSFDGLAIAARNSGTSVNPTMDISKITVTKNIFGNPGPSFAVTGGGTGCPSGDSFVVGLSGSVNTNAYYLLTNGVPNGLVVTGSGAAISFPAEHVASVALTNTVLASNTVSGFTGLMSGSVLVAPLTAPVITGQPAAVVVATNNIGVFAAVVSGSGLNYQWYRNGVKLADGGHVAGSGTATLVISPANNADVATAAQGYYCVITNTCGSQTISTTNSLTLDASVNIVWQGGNPTNNWNLATSANFTNSAGVAVKFNSGDSVTLDDSSSFPVINVVGSYVSPNLITENSSQNYFITANSGPISGPGSLVMSGSGVLTISNANTFSGGVTINSGTLKAQNYASLGSGAINLASGTLELPVSGGSTTGISNNINVTANSTLQYDLNGTYAGVIFGGINGSSAATLNIYNYNANSGSSRLRLYGIFTNNANLSLTTAGSSVDLAPYNGTNGEQVFNGLITGNAGRIVARDAGSVIFNQTNTFNDSGVSTPTGFSLLLSSGNVGLGADSVSSSPPTIDAGPVGTGIIAINTGVEGGNCSLFASGGAHTVANSILYTSATNTVTLSLTGNNSLTLAGNFQLSLATDANGTNRILSVNNTAPTSLSGVISDNGLGSGLIKSGNGSLYLNATNTFTGITTNAAGLLAGSGVIAGPLVVNTNAALGGGSAAAIGTLTISNNLSLSGNLFVRVNKSLAPAQSNDLIAVSGTLNNLGSGNVTVTNLGVPAIVSGDKFKLFSSALAGGNTLTVTGGGMTWTNRLGVDGTIQALAAVILVNTNTTPIAVTNNGSQLTLTWPADHIGWRLLAQTNTLANGLNPATNAWFTVSSSTSTNSVNIPINAANGTVFYRLVYP